VVEFGTNPVLLGMPAEVWVVLFENVILPLAGNVSSPSVPKVHCGAVVAAT
jgi:hypothetical protein